MARDDFAAERLVEVPLGARTTATAGGSGDDTEVTGDAFYRKGIHSMRVGFAIDGTITANQTLTIKDISIEHSSDKGVADAWAEIDTDLLPSPDDLVVAGAGAARYAAGFPLRLRAAKDYIRVKYTPDLSASGTDNVGIAPLGTVAAAVEIPPVVLDDPA